jgi:hypothetical protein
LPEDVDADCHAGMPGTGLCAVGTEQPIPPRQIEAEIAVGLGRLDRVMDPVHLRRNDDHAQKPVDRLR